MSNIDTVTNFFSNNTREIGLYAILMLVGFQLFLWSKENRSLKLALREKQEQQQFYKLGLDSSVVISALQYFYHYKNSSSKKKSSHYSSRNHHSHSRI